MTHSPAVLLHLVSATPILPPSQIWAALHTEAMSMHTVAYIHPQATLHWLLLVHGSHGRYTLKAPAPFQSSCSTPAATLALLLPFLLKTLWGLRRWLAGPWEANYEESGHQWLDVLHPLPQNRQDSWKWPQWCPLQLEYDNRRQRELEYDNRRKDKLGPWKLRIIRRRCRGNTTQYI